MQQLLCEVSAADTNNLFYSPLPIDTLPPAYRRVVHRPLSLSTIAAYIAATSSTSNAAHKMSSPASVANASSSPSPKAYSWQALEDDLVTTLQNCIAFNKIGSSAYVEAVQLLSKLPTIFSNSAAAKKAGYTYSRVVIPPVNKQQQQGATARTSSTSSLTAEQLKDEALMLHFTALMSKELAGVLTSALLTAPVTVASILHPYHHSIKTQLHDEAIVRGAASATNNNANSSALGYQVTMTTSTQSGGSSSVPALVFKAPTPAGSGDGGFAHLIPTTVEALRQQVLIHAFPSLGSFLRTASMMLAFATACCCDEEGVEILTTFQRKIDQQCEIWSATVVAAFQRQNTAAVNEEEGRQNGIENEIATCKSIIEKAKQSHDSNMNGVSAMNASLNSAIAAGRSGKTSDTEKCSSSSSIAVLSCPIRPVCCEALVHEAEKTPIVAAAITNAMAMLSGSAAAAPPVTVPQSPSKTALSLSSSLSSPPPPSSQLYAASVANEQDAFLRASAFALISTLIANDSAATQGSFLYPYLASEYMAAVPKPFDFFTMKLKCALGLYTLPFVGHLPDTRLAVTEKEKKAGEETDNADAANVAGESSTAPATSASPRSQPATPKQTPLATPAANDTTTTTALPPSISSQPPPETDYTVLDGVRALIRADLDTMVDNCTFYNGPDHALSRHISEMRRTFGMEARKCGL